MTLFALALWVHVVTAILGLGQIGAIVVFASAGASADRGTWSALGRFVLTTKWSLIVVLLSGVLVEYASGGAFHGTWWFRISFLALLALGVSNRVIGRALVKREAAGHELTLRKIPRTAWVMCGITAVIAVLMVVKP